VRLHLPPHPAFIPAYQTALFFIDLITAALLLDQFLRLRSVGLLVLAAGYLFDALMIIPHTMSFPGAFAAGGLLGAGPQTTAWLYVFWHGGFPLFVMGYALLRHSAAIPSWTGRHVGWTVGAAVAGVVVVVVALALLTTRGHDLLPVVMQGSDYSMLVSKGISPAVWLLTFAAMLMLWQRNTRVMDLWLMLVMWVWLFDIALAAVLGAKRFDLGFYAGRLFGLIAAGFLLVVLIVEMARMYSGALRAVAEANRPPEPAPGAAEPPVRGSAREEKPTVGVPPMRPRPVDTASFIRGQNIAHYRKLLEAGKLDVAERRTIESLLQAEERLEE
jgi:Membrane-associated sensor, integral membrane domain